LEEAPNVLLLIVDDLRPDLGSYGHPLAETPNMDRLAARGVRFERAYSQFPVCNPSRASLLTGLRPAATGVLDNTTHYRDRLPDAVTLPELFRRNGYFTASVGKVFHGAGGKKNWSDPQAWDVALFPRGRRRARGQEGQRFSFASGNTIGWVAAGGSDEDQPDGQTALATIGVIEQALEGDSGRPFFVAAGFLRPHAPMIAPKSYFERYRADELEPFLADAAGAQREATRAVGKAEVEEISRAGQLELLRAYFACTSFVDAQLGSVLAELDRLDLWRNTIVVLLSDHGLHLGERGWWSKNTLSEVSTRVPLIVHLPGERPRGVATGAVVELVDIYPTLVELANLEGAPGLDGRSLVPVLQNPEIEWKPGAFSQVTRGAVAGYSVRTARWRYTEWKGGGRGVELYDHQADPSELNDLAADPNQAETVERLAALLAETFPVGER
jgi:uncharacterized sulfatase